MNPKVPNPTAAATSAARRAALSLLSFVVLGCAATPSSSATISQAPVTSATIGPPTLASVAPAASRSFAPRPTVNLGPPAGSVEIGITGPPGRFDPPKETVSAGAVTFYLPNHTGIEHTFAITDKPLAFADLGVAKNLPVAISDLIAAGKAMTFTTTLAPGTYTYYCTISNHARNGMFGTLTVKP